MAYGPMPGLELIPYFLALAGWVALAFAGILWSPVAALFRRLRRRTPCARAGANSDGPGALQTIVAPEVAPPLPETQHEKG